LILISPNLGAAEAKAAIIVKPVTYSAGQILPASSLNSDFDTIYNDYNGNITNANISASAAIASTKINYNATAFLKLATGNNTWASGITGDTEPRITMTSDGYLLYGTGSATPDVGIKRSAAHTLQLFNNTGGGNPTLDMNGGTISNATVPPSSLNLTSSTGMVSQTASTTYAARTITAGSGISVSNGSGVSGNPTITLSDITGSTGIIAETAANTYTARTLTAGTGISISNGDGVSGNPTVSITNTAGSGTCTSCNLTVNGQGQITAQSSGVSGASYGGSGVEGAVTESATTYTSPTQRNCTTYTLNNGTTMAFDQSPLIINSTSTTTINGTIEGIGSGNSGGGGGSNGDVGVNGSGIAPGSSHLGSGASGGGGGGHSSGLAISGGRGGAGTSSVYAAASGGSYTSCLTGGSGGGGGASSSTGTGATGGHGGGCIVFCSVGALQVGSTGVINMTGGVGTNGSGNNGGGGGGGSGGEIWLTSQTSVTTIAGGALIVSGGNGGNGSGAGGSGGGGGGGCGRIFLWSPSITDGATSTYGGGSGGTATGAGQAGEAGQGIVPSNTQIVGSPNLPLLVWMGLRLPADIASARTWGDGPRWMESKHQSKFTAREIARAYSAGNIDLYAKALTPGFDAEETCLDDNAEALRDAS
jgi:hypothetical protein